MFAKKVSVYAGLERRERPNCISEKCIKCAPKRKAVCSNHIGDASALSRKVSHEIFRVFVSRKPPARRVVQKKPAGDDVETKTPFVVK